LGNVYWQLAQNVRKKAVAILHVSLRVNPKKSGTGRRGFR